MSTRVAFSSSVSKEARSIPAAANAASVGAKTVNGPSPCSAVTRSAWSSAATRESCCPVSCAFVSMSSDSSAATIGLSDIAPMVKVTYIPTMIGIIILLFISQLEINPLMKECLISTFDDIYMCF